MPSLAEYPDRIDTLTSLSNYRRDPVTLTVTGDIITPAAKNHLSDAVLAMERDMLFAPVGVNGIADADMLLAVMTAIVPDVVAGTAYTLAIPAVVADFIGRDRLEDSTILLYDVRPYYAGEGESAVAGLQSLWKDTTATCWPAQQFSLVRGTLAPEELILTFAPMDPNFINHPTYASRGNAGSFLLSIILAAYE